MREILFRGKRVDNGEWVYGYLFKWPMRGWKSLSTAIVPIDSLENGIAEQVEVDPDTVGQYTGLTDANGNRVFEGDIIRNIEGIAFSGQYDFVVKFTEGEFYGENSLLEIQSRNFADSIVIGNITDNPDMITDKGKG